MNSLSLTSSVKYYKIIKNIKTQTTYYTIIYAVNVKI